MVGPAERVRRIHPDDRGRVLQEMASFEATGGWDTEYRIVIPDRVRSAGSTTHPPGPGNRRSTGHVVRRAHAYPRRDESARKLADAETRYQALIEQLPAVVYIDTYEADPVTL